LLYHILLILLGMALIIAGFWGSTQLRKPYDALIAWCAPVGLLVVLAGVVMLIIPNFFA
jgi:hypothetical protein